MKKPILIGLDVGTTNLKALAITPEGELKAQIIKPMKLHTPQPNWAEYEPEEVWQILCEALQELITIIAEKYEPAGIAAASMGEAGVLIDKDGKPLYPIIAWYDPRTEPQLHELSARFGERELYQLTGLPLHTMYSINKLMWLKQHIPQAYKAAKRWLCITDYVIFKLAGEFFCDYSIASRTMGLDLLNKRWSSEIFEAAGISCELMCELVGSGKLVGKVSREAARSTGLPEGLPVVSGGHDHTCAALACGITMPGAMLVSTGTTEAFLLTLEVPILSDELMVCGYAYECHVVPDRYILFGFIPTAGVLLDWLIALFGYRNHRQLLELAEQSPEGANGLFLLPHFRGTGTPQNDPYSKGAFLGLTCDHNKMHLARATIEGICYELRYNIEIIEKLLNCQVSVIKAVGGGSQSNFWLQLKADISGKPMEAAQQLHEATAFGAAILAGIGTGIYKDYNAPQDKIHIAIQKFLPRADRKLLYQDLYIKIYKRLYEQLKDINREIYNVSTNKAAEKLR